MFEFNVRIIKKTKNIRNLPEQQQRTLQLLKNNSAGLSTMQLQAEGVIDPAYMIGQLRKKGCLINTERVTVTDPNGEVHFRVANYVYQGWEKPDAA